MHGKKGIPSRPLSNLWRLELGSGTCGVGIVPSVFGADMTITDQESFVYLGSQVKEHATASLTESNVPKVSLVDLARANAQQNITAFGTCGD